MICPPPWGTVAEGVNQGSGSRLVRETVDHLDLRPAIWGLSACQRTQFPTISWFGVVLRVTPVSFWPPSFR
jgi:hypothetical protein